MRSCVHSQALGGLLGIIWRKEKGVKDRRCRSLGLEVEFIRTLERKVEKRSGTDGVKESGTEKQASFMVFKRCK